MNPNRILLLIITALSLTTQSHAMLPMSSQLRTPAQLRLLAQSALKKGMHTTCTTAQQQAPKQHGRRYFLAGAAAVSGLYFGVPYALENHRSLLESPRSLLERFHVATTRQANPAARIPAREQQMMELVTLHAQSQETFNTFMKDVMAAGHCPHTFKTKTGETPLRIACRFGDVELFKQLIECDGNSVINDEFKFERLAGVQIPHTILSYLIYEAPGERSTEMVQYLLSNPSLDIDFAKTDRLAKISPEDITKYMQEFVHNGLLHAPWPPKKANDYYCLYRVRQEEKKIDQTAEHVKQTLKLLYPVPVQ